MVFRDSQTKSLNKTKKHSFCNPWPNQNYCSSIK